MTPMIETCDGVYPFGPRRGVIVLPRATYVPYIIWKTTIFSMKFLFFVKVATSSRIPRCASSVKVSESLLGGFIGFSLKKNMNRRPKTVKKPFYAYTIYLNRFIQTSYDESVVTPIASTPAIPRPKIEPIEGISAEMAVDLAL